MLALVEDTWCSLYEQPAQSLLHADIINGQYTPQCEQQQRSVVARMRKENAPYNMHNSSDTLQELRFEMGIWDMQVFCKRPWGEGSTGGWWMVRVAPLASWACGPPELSPSLRTMIQVRHLDSI